MTFYQTMTVLAAWADSLTQGHPGAELSERLPDLEFLFVAFLCFFQEFVDNRPASSHF
jgi:hypothetical protein